MDEYNVFVSVGGTATDKQETFVRAVEDRLRGEGIIPHTVGRNTFSVDSPLKTVMDLMGRCQGAVVIALERTYFPSGIEKRDGHDQRALSEVRYPTPWNQIESAIAYTRGLPLLVIVEKGLEDEGLLQEGYEWYVQWVDPTKDALNSLQFNGVLSSWKSKVVRSAATAAVATRVVEPLDQMTVGFIISRMKAGQLWAVLGAITTLVVGAFALGAKYFHSP